MMKQQFGLEASWGLRRYSAQIEGSDRCYNYIPPRRSYQPSSIQNRRRLEKTDVKVIVRIRPSVHPQTNLAFFVTGNAASSGNLLWQPDSRRATCEETTFHKVFGPTITNASVHDELDLETTVRNAVNGYAETIFAYGQTGSGKTHTMIGTCDPSDEGVLQRCTRDLFQIIPTVLASQRLVQLMCVEIKNNSTVVDLLAKEESSSTAPSSDRTNTLDCEPYPSR